MAYIEWLRSKIGHQKILLVFGCAIIRDELGRVLWQQRGDFGWWGLPGGVLEFDETLSECVMREVLEETHLLVEPLRLVGIYSSPDYDVRYPNGDQLKVALSVFCCEPVVGSLRADGQESSEVRFFELDHLPPLDEKNLRWIKEAWNSEAGAIFR